MAPAHLPTVPDRTDAVAFRCTSSPSRSCSACLRGSCHRLVRVRVRVRARVRVRVRVRVSYEP